MLETLWRKRNPSALLVGLQTGAATMENSMEFPQKTKNGTALWPILFLDVWTTSILMIGGWSLSRLQPRGAGSGVSRGKGGLTKEWNGAEPQGQVGCEETKKHMLHQRRASYLIVVEMQNREKGWGITNPLNYNFLVQQTLRTHWVGKQYPSICKWWSTWHQLTALT